MAHARAGAAGTEVELTCAGRTDAGVHAWGQVVSFVRRGRGARPLRHRRARSRRSTSCAARRGGPLGRGGRRRFDARFSARSRRYRYTILNTPVPDPFLHAHDLARGRAARPAGHAPGLRPAHRRARLLVVLPPPQAHAGRRAGVADPAGARGPLGATPATASCTSRSRPTPSATRWCARSPAPSSRSGRATKRPGEMMGIINARDRHAAGDLAPGPRPRASGRCATTEPPVRRSRPANCSLGAAARIVAGRLGAADSRADSPSIRKSKGTRRAHVHPESQRDRACLARRRRRGPGARSHGHRGRPHPPRQAQADLRPAHRHRRPRDHHQRRQGRAHRRARPRRSRSTATPGYPGGISSRTYAELLGQQARGGGAPHHPRHAPQEPPRPGHSSRSSRSTPARPTPTPPSSPSRSSIDHASASRADGRTRTGTSDDASPSSSPPAAASAPSPVSASAPAPATITVNRRDVEDYFPSDTHRMILTEPLRLTRPTEAYDIDATHPRRRRHRPGRRPAPRHRPGAHRARPRAARRRSRRPASSPATPARRNPRSTASRRPARLRSTPSADPGSAR